MIGATLATTSPFTAVLAHPESILIFCALACLARTAHLSLLHGVEVFRINQPLMPDLHRLQTLSLNHRPHSARTHF
jgi:hypothetical protein